MSNLLQLHSKKRKRNGAFYDELRNQFQDHDLSSSQPASAKLTTTLHGWLVEDGILEGDRAEVDFLTPLDLGDVISDRVCEIAGHVWLEFSEDASADSVRGTAHSSYRAELNAYVAEFVPDIEIDNVLEAFQSSKGGPLPWNQVNDKNILKLFEPLMEESFGERQSPLRPRAGSLPGGVNLIYPNQLKGHGQSWFKDREDADITPTWVIDPPVVIIDSIHATPAGSRYSFTPEHIVDADNCITWASRVLDRVTNANWLATLRGNCETTVCGVPSAKPCDDLHIQAEGRMKCIAGYVSQADAKRREGLGAFHD